MQTYQDFIVFLLAKANQRSQGMLKKALKPYGLTPVQGLILEALYNEDGLTAGDIGKRLLLDNATVSGVLERLSDAGWIHKGADADDRRMLRIHLSEKSHEHRETMMQERQHVSEEILAGFSPEERILLKRFLKDIFT